MAATLTSNAISLDQLLNSTIDGIFVLDAQRGYVMFNTAFKNITGFNADELLGWNCRCADVMHCQDDFGRPLAGVLCPAKALLEGTIDSARQRMQIRRLDGSQTWVETIYTTIQDHAGRPEYVLGIVRDANETRAREDELRREMSRLSAQQEATPTVAPQNPNAPQPVAKDAATLRLDPFLERVERDAIRRALKAANGQRNKAARIMGISRSRLYRRMEALAIDPNQHT